MKSVCMSVWVCVRAHNSTQELDKPDVAPKTGRENDYVICVHINALKLYSLACLCRISGENLTEGTRDIVSVYVVCVAESMNCTVCVCVCVLYLLLRVQNFVHPLICVEFRFWVRTKIPVYLHARGPLNTCIQNIFFHILQTPLSLPSPCHCLIKLLGKVWHSTGLIWIDLLIS